MPIGRFDLTNRRGQLRGPELERLQREAVSSRTLAGSAGLLQSSSGVALPPQAPASGDVFGKITSASKDANGMYPAALETWSAASLAWIDGGTIKVLPANGETLTNGIRYEVVFLDTLSGTPVYGTTVTSLPAFSGASLASNGTISLTGGTEQIITLAAATGTHFDTDNYFNAANPTRLSATTAASPLSYYLAQAVVNIPIATNQDLFINIYTNGNHTPSAALGWGYAYAGFTTSPSTYATAVAAAYLAFDSTNYVEFGLKSAQNASIIYATFSMTKLR